MSQENVEVRDGQAATGTSSVGRLIDRNLPYSWEPWLFGYERGPAPCSAVPPAWLAWLNLSYHLPASNSVCSACE